MGFVSNFLSGTSTWTRSHGSDSAHKWRLIGRWSVLFYSPAVDTRVGLPRTHPSSPRAARGPSHGGDGRAGTYGTVYCHADFAALSVNSRRRSRAVRVRPIADSRRSALMNNHTVHSSTPSKSDEGSLARLNETWTVYFVDLYYYCRFSTLSCFSSSSAYTLPPKFIPTSTWKQARYTFQT